KVPVDPRCPLRSAENARLDRSIRNGKWTIDTESGRSARDRKERRAPRPEQSCDARPRRGASTVRRRPFLVFLALLLAKNRPNRVNNASKINRRYCGFSLKTG